MNSLLPWNRTFWKFAYVNRVAGNYKTPLWHGAREAIAIFFALQGRFVVFVNEIARITVTYIHHDVLRVCYYNVHTRSISTLFAISSSNKNLLTYQFLITTPYSKKIESTPRSASGNATTCCYLFLFLDKNPVTFPILHYFTIQQRTPIILSKSTIESTDLLLSYIAIKHFLPLWQFILSVITNTSLFSS